MPCKRKVVRGGSWKDSEYFLRNSTRTFEYQNSPKSYIGFRSVIVVPGEQSKEPDNLFYYFINGYGYIKKSNIGLDSFINWGATIVIIGLMFKLQHWQWGDWMIVIGLGAEAIIFLILGYQAIGNSEEQETKPSVAAVQTGHAASLDDMLSQSDISPQDIQNLGKGYPDSVQLLNLYPKWPPQQFR